MVQLKLEREDSRLVASPASGAELGGVLSENVRQIFFFKGKTLDVSWLSHFLWTVLPLVDVDFRSELFLKPMLC